MEITRRDFLRLFGGASGAVMLGGCGLEDMVKVPEGLVERAKRGAGIETWKSTVCGMCPGGCGMSVRLVDEIPVYVKGNPLHPLNQGGMCPLGLNALHELYHPDRLVGPVKRAGNVGSGSWESITWDEALTTIADALKKLRRENKSHQVALLGYDERGLMQQHLARFMQAYGSPNYFQFSPLQNDEVPYSLVHGHAGIPSHDFLGAKLIVSFGANFLEEGYSPVYYTKVYSLHRERGTRYVQIESRMSLTAANAERWIPIRPGTYGALALGIAYVLIREDMYDEEFVRSQTHGFEDWVDSTGREHRGFKSVVLGNYYPDVVSEITGIPSATILEIARELGNTRPALVLGDRGAMDNTNGTFALMAVESLNALLGNYDREGGIHFVEDPPFAVLPPVRLDAAARNGARQIPIARPRSASFPLARFSIDSFMKNVLEGRPYDLSMLFLYRGNPLFQTLNQRKFTDALNRIPLIVSFDSIINETSEVANIVLPDHTFLERWDEIMNVPSVGFAHVSVQQPVVQPLYDTRHAGDVIIDLANRVGGTVAGSFPFGNYHEEITYRLKGVYDSGEGAVVSESARQKWMEFLQQRGWQIGRYASFEEFWKLLVERGGWWNPIRKQPRKRDLFKTPSGKFEFYSRALKAAVDKCIEEKRGEDLSYDIDYVLNQLGISARGDSVYLPHHEPVPSDADRPIHLIEFQVLPNRDGHGAYLPMMQEMFGYSTRRYWGSWVEIHPETAALYGIGDGARVWVESSIGSLEVEAKITPGILPNVVAIPFGMGHWSHGRYAKGHGVNPRSIMKDLYDMVSGKPALEATKVRIFLSS